LSKNRGNCLENLKDIANETIRHPIFSYGDKSYGHGHNRVALDLPMTLPNGPYYAVFECKEYTKTVLFVVSQ